MKTISNPESGADIIDRNVDGALYTIKKGETLENVRDEVAEVFSSVYGFLSVTDQVETKKDVEASEQVKETSDNKEEVKEEVKEKSEENEVKVKSKVGVSRRRSVRKK